MSTEPSRKSSVPDPLVGRTLVSRFRIIDRIATGGMGAVYLAEQIQLGREVAIKILEVKQLIDSEDSFKQRFFLEAAAAAKLKHPNTIVVHDYGQTDDGMYFIAMEYIEGTTLERRLKKHGAMTPAQALHIALQVCSSLREAHERGLVHRDMKPGNIMFAPRARDPLFVKVLDFGLVKHVATDDEGALTNAGVVMGSPRYMAPEQVRTLDVDPRTDIYSLGATLYHMVTGAPPFAGGKPFDAMTAHVTTPPPPLKTSWPDCPVGPRFEAAIMRCLEKNPDARFQSMDDLMNELHACFDEAGANLPSGSGYVSHLSMRITLDGMDSDPRLNPTPSGLKWSEESAPKISGARPKQIEDETIDVEVPITDDVAPKRPSNLKWIIAAGALAFCTAIIVGFVTLFSGDDDAEPAAAQQPVAAQAVDRPDVESAPSAPTATLVQLRSDPPGATVRHDGADIGDAPIGIPVPAGESWEVELELDGYQPRRVTLLAGQPEITIRLRPIAAQPAAGPSADGIDWEARRRLPGRREEPAAEQPSAVVHHPQPAAEETGETGHRDLHDPWDEQ